ncbi:M20/M25/M40 family metallo-hydrolase, partial [Promineifilum sp.]|uniref:M20/M25/M40 family metallo-hydrolase n=1 Tax=Promineifilum sp. TaxID=2664178 RepID=UPI0035AFA748
MRDRILELAIAVQQVAAPTFEEKARADFVQATFNELNLLDVSQDELGNVYGRLAGDGAGDPLVAVAHLDTVFPNGTSLEVREEGDKVYGPGLGDNSVGVAALVELAHLIRQRKIELGGDLWLVADVGEEGLGDLRGMRKVVERFGAQVQGYLIIEGLALGHVYHRAIGVRRYRVTARTAGGHSWSDYGQPSAVHELARLVTQITALHVPVTPRTTLNVGVIAGGTTINTLAEEAWFELDLRSENADSLAILNEQVQKLIAAANRPGVSVESRPIGQRPAGEIAVHHPLIQLGIRCLEQQGLSGSLTAGSTDANIPLSMGIPAVVLGVTTGGGAHTKREFILSEPIEQGMNQLVC